MTSRCYRNPIFALLSLMTITGVRAQPDAYRQEIKKWDLDRVKELKAEDGWLNLAGLYWLDEGINTFGAGRGNKIIFPAGTIAEKAGYLELSGNKVVLVTGRNDIFSPAGHPVKKELVFDGDAAVTTEKIISSGRLRWTIIKRGQKFGVRLRNLGSSAAANFPGIRRYHADTAWIIPATLEKSNTADISITNVLGQTSAERSPGKLTFYKNGIRYTLAALEEGRELFVIFSDATSGSGTYPSGRFLSVHKPDASGKTRIDFNKAYNPPCAFTPYATCPLPPKENHLSLAVTAGEKYTSH